MAMASASPQATALATMTCLKKDKFLPDCFREPYRIIAKEIGIVAE
jgi:hypothetical protein